MGIKKSYAVVGLGRYGFSVARELVSVGADVLAIDSSETVINMAATELPYCKCADITDPEVIKRLGIASIDVVVIAMAHNLEASVLAVMLCKEAGVKTVIAKCSSEMNMKILRKVGADKVVFPENESGIRLAKNLLSSGFVDVIDLSREVSLVELEVKPEWVGKSLVDLNLRKKYSVNVVAIREGDRLVTSIDPYAPLAEGSQIVIITSTSTLAKLR